MPASMQNEAAVTNAVADRVSPLKAYPHIATCGVPSSGLPESCSASARKNSVTSDCSISRCLVYTVTLSWSFSGPAARLPNKAHQQSNQKRKNASGLLLVLSFNSSTCACAHHVFGDGRYALVHRGGNGGRRATLQVRCSLQQ